MKSNESIKDIRLDFENKSMKHKPLAKTSKRVLATIIDYAVFFAITWVYTMYFGQETTEGYQIGGILALPIPIFWFLYFVVVEGFWQATLGLCRPEIG